MREEICVNQVDWNEFKCPICIQVFHKPMKTSCGHNFCGKCISKWMQKKKQCPFCRKEFPNYNFYERDKKMEFRVEMLEVTCLRCNNWSGHLIELKNHRAHQCASSEIVIQPNDILIIQDDLEDPQQMIMDEILSIKNQQNYSKLLEIENNLIFSQKIQNKKEPNLRKKRKKDNHNNHSNQIDQEVEELSTNEINTLKNSDGYQIRQINKRFQLQNKFLKEIMEGQYQNETKQFFATLLYYRNLQVFMSMNQKQL